MRCIAIYQIYLFSRQKAEKPTDKRPRSEDKMQKKGILPQLNQPRLSILANLLLAIQIA